MKGLPKRFETKADVLNSLQMFPEQTRQAVSALYADRFIFTRDIKLKNKEDGVEDAEHRIFEEEYNGETVFWQYKKIVDKNAQIYQLGFTDAEIKNILK